MKLSIDAGGGAPGEPDRDQILVTVRSADGEQFTAVARKPTTGLLRRAGTDAPVAADAPDSRRLSAALLVPELVSLLERERRRFAAPLRIMLSIPDDAAHGDLRAVPWELCAIGAWTGETFDRGRPIPLTWHPQIQLVRVVHGATAEARQRAIAGRMLLAAAYTTAGELDGISFDPLMAGHLERSDVSLAAQRLEGTALAPLPVSPGFGRSSVSGLDIARAVGTESVAAFYFAGHHGPDGLVVSSDGDQGDKQPAWFTADHLVGLLQRAGAQVVVLMACDTGRPAAERAPMIANYQSFAEVLVLMGIPWVVSAQAAITNSASQEFGPTFVDWLANGATVVEAAQAASAETRKAAGLMVIHCAPGQPDPYVPEARPPATPLLAELTRPGGRTNRMVNPEVRWGLDRRPLRAILDAGEEAPRLTARLNHAEVVIRRGIFDFDPWWPHERREWLDVDPFRRPVTGPSLADLAAVVSSPPRWLRANAADSSGLGFVIHWDPDSDTDVPGHIAALQSYFPESAIVTCAYGRDHRAGTARLKVHLERMGGGQADVLVRMADVYGEQPVGDQAAAVDADDPDAAALDALRNIRQVGWREAEARISDGASTEVRAVYEYLRERGADASADLAFLCQATPSVVDAAWRAGVQPAFDVRRLPEGAEVMPGCWTLLARSPLTTQLVCWLGRNRELAVVTGLFGDGGPDAGHEKILLQVRDGYGI